MAAQHWRFYSHRFNLFTSALPLDPAYCRECVVYMGRKKMNRAHQAAVLRAFNLLKTWSR